MTKKNSQLVYRENIVYSFAKEIDKYYRIYSDNNCDDNIKLLEQLRE